MKYATEITIDLPRDRVVELFDSVDNLYQWQPGLESFEHVSGEPGEEGARSQMVYDENGRRIEMTETILKRNFPDEFAARYVAKGVTNVSTHRFYEDGPDKTRWVSEDEFEFSGFMKLIALVMRGSFPKQTMTFKENFKAFAESAGVN